MQRALDNLDNSFTVGNDYAFCANDGTHYILLKIKSPKGGGNYGYDVWADEETVAKATVAQMDTVVHLQQVELVLKQAISRLVIPSVQYLVKSITYVQQRLICPEQSTL